MENKLFAYFDDKPLVAYPIVNGAVYSEEFNETIDSFSIIIDNVADNDFIDLSRPYHIVKIVNKGTNGITWNGNNYIFMFTDSTMISKTNIHDNIYCYTIGLMNIVKVLENIQCPNLVITHDLVIGQTQTIYDYIDKYMTLYCPKIKVVNGNNWEYQYLFEWKTSLNKIPFNNTLVADMQVNEPTLRDLLTNLMIQVDCIPTIENKTIKFINFKKKPSTFAYLNNGVNHFSISNASDSYINTLIQSPSQVLDRQNIVTENIGFRDRNNVAVKQTENLYLTTRFPIYDIEQVRMYVNKKIAITYTPSNIDSLIADNKPYCTIGSSNDDELVTGRCMQPLILNNNTLRINFIFNKSTYHKGYIKNLNIHLCRLVDNTPQYEEISSMNFPSWFINFDDNSSNNTVEATGVSGETTFVAQQLLANGQLSRKYYGTDENLDEYPIYYNVYNYFLETPVDLTNVTHIWIQFDFQDNVDGKIYYCFYPLLFINTTDYQDITYIGCTGFVQCTYTTGQAPGSYLYFQTENPMSSIPSDDYPIYADVTPLFVEKNKRQLLETNYLNMPSSGTMEDLAKYIYGTVQYTIGGREITGFSDTYSYSVGWWQESRSYIDNIIFYIINNNLIDVYQDIPELATLSLQYANMPTNKHTIMGVGGSSFLHYIEKSKYGFEITYHPLNDFKMKWSKKEEFDYPIERLNNLDSGLSTFNRLSKKAQSMVDRIGNAILTITQTTDNFANIQKVNSLYKDYTIFKRQIAIERNYFSITYYASKNYVMQNYFTSITTKYRAYQYVDYNSSVVRKENKTIYCLLAKDYYIDGDDNLIVAHPLKFLAGISDYDNQYNLKYVFEKSLDKNNTEQITKNALSILTYENGIALCTLDYDNVSAGPYLPSYNVDNNIGGIRQEWQIWKQDIFNEKHYIYYVCHLTTDNLQVGDFTDSNYFPIITNNWDWNNYVEIRICDNKLLQNEYTFYKDLAEVINFTLQFEFYTNDDDICWSRYLFENSPLIQQSDLKPNRVVDITQRETFECRENATIDYPEYANIDDFIEIDTENGVPYIKVKWSSISNDITQFTISKITYISVELYISTDFIAFKRNGATADVKYYLSFNDNKSTTARKYYTDQTYFGLYKRVKCKKGLLREYEEN